MEGVLILVCFTENNTTRTSHRITPLVHLELEMLDYGGSGNIFEICSFQGSLQPA